LTFLVKHRILLEVFRIILEDTSMSPSCKYISWYTFFLCLLSLQRPLVLSLDLIMLSVGMMECQECFCITSEFQSRCFKWCHQLYGFFYAHSQADKLLYVAEQQRIILQLLLLLLPVKLRMWAWQSCLFLAFLEKGMFRRRKCGVQCQR
jgi:hypothetical protein